MMKTLWVLTVILLSCLSGCSSVITAWKARPAAQHELTTGEFWTLTGERRLAFFTKRPTPDQFPVWCAESLPEASMAVAATSKPSLALPEKLTTGTDESFTSTLLQTSTRTEIAELYRQMTFLNCQTYALGVFSAAEYKSQIVKLTDAGLLVIEARSKQPLGSTGDNKKSHATTSSASSSVVPQAPTSNKSK